jgi:hypothetical protein
MKFSLQHPLPGPVSLRAGTYGPYGIGSRAEQNQSRNGHYLHFFKRSTQSPRGIGCFHAISLPVAGIVAGNAASGGSAKHPYYQNPDRSI